MARGVTTAALLTAFLVLTAACFGGGGEPSEAELVDRMLESSDLENAREAARTLAAAPGCGAARTVASGTSDRRLLLRDAYIGVMRTPASGVTVRARAITCLAPFDDAESATAVARPLLSDTAAPRLRKAAAQALPTMSRSVSSVIPSLVRSGRTLETGPHAKELTGLLAEIGPSVMPSLLPLVAQSEWAVNTLVAIGRPSLEPLRTQYRTGRTLHARAAAGIGLLRLRDSAPGQVRPLVPEIVETMVEELAGSFENQFVATEVLAEAGRPAVDPLVAILRKDPAYLSEHDRKIWSGASNAIATVGARNPKAVAPVLAALRRRDYSLIHDLRSFYIRIGVGTEELIAALPSQADTGYVFDLVFSGNRRLDKATREWASANGYTITGRQAPGSGPWATLKLGSQKNSSLWNTTFTG